MSILDLSKPTMNDIGNYIGKPEDTRFEQGMIRAYQIGLERGKKEEFKNTHEDNVIDIVEVKK